MEANPPSYDAATLVDHWDLIANYIPSDDLCSAALVCSRWHATFSPHLWGNPASHFGIENDRVYVALTKFKRTLHTARLLVRAQTHTLHLPPAHAEIYNGPHADWLRDILFRLPNLQSLIVRGLPFFDHSALVALRQWKPKETSIRQQDPHAFAVELPGSNGAAFQQPLDTLPSFGLRLLDASRCSNVTSHALAQALRHFESLMYLDLSRTSPARDVVVLSTLRRFSGLQVLKLRGINLRDYEVEILAKAIERRVRSLDIRDNSITDHGVRTLLDGCFANQSQSQSQSQLDGAASSNGARSPALLPYLGMEMLDIYQNENFEGFLRNAFTTRFVSRLAIEDAPEGGITHLYISNNKLSVEGVSGLAMSERLHVLDAGAVSQALRKHPALSDENSGALWDMPGAEKLAPLLHTHGKDSLTFLKLDHSVLTKEAPNTHPQEVVLGRAELADTAFPDLPPNIPELDGAGGEVVELPADEQTTRYELPADSTQITITSVKDMGHPPDYAEDAACGPRRGSALAPEVVQTVTAGTERMALLSPISRPTEETISADDQSVSARSSPSLSPSAISPARSPRRGRTYSSVASERVARLNAHKAQSHRLHPAMLPHLRTLVLTDFPGFSRDRELVERFICFIKACADESNLARAHAKLDYSLPPGRRGQASALRHSAEKIFALQRIILEIAPERATQLRSQASPWQHTDTRSMTGDRDSEALWSAAEADFSFFGDEEESTFPSIESGRFGNTTASAEKEVTARLSPSVPSPGSGSRSPEPPKVDNIALLAAFRKERSLAHQRSLAAGATEPETEGYWDGLIQVVRLSRDMRRDEELDYYGNKFEKNYLYR